MSEKAAPEEKPRPSRRRLGRPRKVVVGGTAAVLLAGTGVGTGLAVTAGPGPSYRLATASMASVTQALTSVGTVATVNKATLAFPVAGTVTAVPVAIGDQVTAGQTLAGLDPGPLRRALDAANATLANARLALTADESGQTSSATASGTGPGTFTAAGAVATSLADVTGSSFRGGSSSAGIELISSSTGRSPAPTPAAAPAGTTDNGTTEPGTLLTAVTTAQQDVENAQSSLDSVLAGLGADLGKLTSPGGGCVVVAGPPRAPITYTTTPVLAAPSDATGKISGTAGADDAITLLRDGAVVASVTGSYAFTGLDAGTPYTVKIEDPDPTGSVDALQCQHAIGALVARYSTSPGPSQPSDLATLVSQLAAAKLNLDAAVRDLGTAGVPTAGVPTAGVPTAGVPTADAPTAPAASAIPTEPAQPTQPTQPATSSARPLSAPAPWVPGATGGPAPAPSHGPAPSSSGGGSTVRSGSSAGSSRSVGGGTSSGGTSSRAARVVTAEQLAADQAAIDAAVAQVALAQQNLAETTLTSPVTGTVAAVSISPGMTVGAFSSTNAITVLGAGGKQVVTTVPLSAVDLVRPGDRADVTVDGVSTPLTGTVSSIGVLNSTTGSTTTYPVKIALAATRTKLFDGTGATVSIVVREVRNMLTVPTSAVHRVGGLSTVSVLRKGKAVTVRVTTGAVGADRTEVTSGLTAGNQVILADLHAALPSARTNSSSTRGGALSGGGGLFGAGGGGGGGGGAGGRGVQPARGG
ncbi:MULTISPECIES: HlyD family efflux transporter periplasmic adaptor subunit [unclassified Frankia]|uniref:HlyD family efflux transporter periplasmic adaptor subunit n=1 Tax=unclassified Frankia TaxID=2632575 RepID=UPI00041561AF|nr:MULTISPECIES: biotin/lipoyl-binding protein [unclassified Frankia]